MRSVAKRWVCISWDSDGTGREKSGSPFFDQIVDDLFVQIYYVHGKGKCDYILLYNVTHMYVLLGSESQFLYEMQF